MFLSLQLVLSATLPRAFLHTIMSECFAIRLTDAAVVDYPVTRSNMTLLNVASAGMFHVFYFCVLYFYLLYFLAVQQQMVHVETLLCG